MAPLPYYMDYTIIFENDDEYLMATAIAGGNLLLMTPRDAATLFGIPYPYTFTGPRRLGFFFPYFIGSQIGFPGPSGVFIDDTILTVLVAGQAAFPGAGGVAPHGPDATFTWSGNITKSGAGATTGEPAPAAISQRRWIAGSELAELLEGATQNPALSIGRDFSRTTDGYGWCIRGNNINIPLVRRLDTLRPGLSIGTSWERFYIRVRRNPTTNDVGLWRCKDGFGVAGAAITLRNGGGITSSSFSSSAVEVNKGTFLVPTLNTWYRIDILLKYGTLGSMNFAVYINGNIAANWTHTTGGDVIHFTSELMKWTAAIDNEVEVDFDDWVNAELPGNIIPGTIQFADTNYPIDWLVGSHIRRHENTTISQVNWAPAGAGKGVTNQANTPDIRPLGTCELTSSTSGATLEALTDAPLQSAPDSIANVLGAAAAIVTIWSKNSAGTNGLLGYRKAGAAATLTAIDQVASEDRNYATYFPSGMILPDEISPWSIVHTKSADANLDTTYMLQTIVEYLGVWGPEDDSQFQYPISRLSNLHNARYSNTVWGYMGSQPAAPQYSIGFTYVGNGTYQEFVLPAACQFLRIRPVTDVTAGIYFFGASLGAHLGAGDIVCSGVRMWFDGTTGEFKFSVTGSDTTGVNINAKTYQVIAFCDPGMRFSVATAFWHGANSSVPKPNPLIAPDFLPTVGFFQFDFTANTFPTRGMFAKGPGNLTDNAYNIQTPNVSSNPVANFSLGSINSFAQLHSNTTGPCNAIVFRTQDSGADGCSGYSVLQVNTYVGNGAGGNRVIPLTPASGRYPLLTFVWPEGTGAAYQRDPSHTGSNSSGMKDNVNSATAITAVGIDQISVGTTLNTNLVVYTVFTICGDSAGANNGTFYSTYCNGDGPYIKPAIDTTSVNVITNGGLTLNGTPALTLLKDISGIYTLKPGQTHDTLIDRQAGQTSVDTKIPDPKWGTGYYGG